MVHEAASRFARNFLLALAAICCSAAGAAGGVDLAGGHLVINGAGGAAFAITGNNAFQDSALNADTDGTFRNLDFSLALTARLSPQITVATQLFFDEIGAPEAGVDWSFVEIRFANWLKVRAGKVKLPFGISNEVEAVGTLRPFYSLPATVYGPTAITTEAYYGVGLTGEIFGGPGWTLDYDLYGGETTLVTVEPFSRLTAPLVPGAVVAADEDDARGLFGGRLTLGTPVEGLSLRGSAYRAMLDDSSFLVAMLSVEYAGDRWLVRAEGFRAAETTMNHGGYLEVARFLTPQIQIATQLQGMRTHATGVPDGSSLLWHLSATLGLNYWFSPGMVVKAAISGIEGNRLAFPQRLDDALLSGTLSKETPFFTLGTQFSF
jgi:hypothetical protein